MSAMDQTEERPTDSVLESVRTKAPEAVWQRFGASSSPFGTFSASVTGIKALGL